jgi:rhamnose transport system permease protein
VAIALVVLLVHLASPGSGRAQFYAIGSNPDAAEPLPGSTRACTIFTAFVLAGALAGLAGFMFLARFGNITVVAGLGFELKSVARSSSAGSTSSAARARSSASLIGAILST